MAGNPRAHWCVSRTQADLGDFLPGRQQLRQHGLQTIGARLQDLPSSVVRGVALGLLHKHARTHVSVNNTGRMNKAGGWRSRQYSRENKKEGNNAGEGEGKVGSQW